MDQGLTVATSATAELEELKAVEVGLWHDNDVRTWAYTTTEFLRVDNCGRRVGAPGSRAGE